RRGPALAHPGRLVWRAGGPRETGRRGRFRARHTGGSGVRAKKGAIVTVSTAPPAGSVSVCLDQMGPESAKSYRGQGLVRALPDPTSRRPAERATQEVDYGRRGKGYIFGAFKPADGEAFTQAYD